MVPGTIVAPKCSGARYSESTSGDQFLWPPPPWQRSLKVWSRPTIQNRDRQRRQLVTVWKRVTNSHTHEYSTCWQSDSFPNWIAQAGYRILTGSWFVNQIIAFHFKFRFFMVLLNSWQETVIVDSIAASLFENNLLSWQIVSDDKIQRTLLIPERGALSCSSLIFCWRCRVVIDDDVWHTGLKENFKWLASDMRMCLGKRGFILPFVVCFRHFSRNFPHLL